jgi:hypothetical protein
MKQNQRLLQTAAWALSALTVTLGFIAWGQQRSWQFGSLSTYTLFPLFGLLAFGLMWSHYVVAAVRKYLALDKKVLKTYIETTSLGVLAMILLHPGLLIWQLWRDGFGLPPGSYITNYVAPGLGWVALLGTVSLLVFIAYELRRVFEDRPWWKYIQYASDAAMLAIFYHSLRLGSTLQNDWLRGVWYIYAASFLLVLIYLYIPNKRKHMEEDI